MTEIADTFRCGSVAIIGRPNVGKSTLLNHLIGQKISITSRKPQTTRHRLLGIKTTADYQIIYVDTPGIHKKVHHALNRYMNRIATAAIFDVDLIIFMVEGLQWRDDDDWVLKKISEIKVPVLLVVNKVDKVKDKSLLLPYMDGLAEKRDFAAIIPLCANRMADVQALEEKIISYLPVAAAVYPEDQITDRSERFFVTEIIREKLMRCLGQELPYAITVEIEEFKTEPNLTRIAAVIYVEKASQKPMIIGEGGSRLKQVGQESRLEIERLVDQKVFLQLWVKVKRGWADNDKNLRSMGYSD